MHSRKHIKIMAHVKHAASSGNSKELPTSCLNARSTPAAADAAQKATNAHQNKAQIHSGPAARGAAHSRQHCRNQNSCNSSSSRQELSDVVNFNDSDKSHSEFFQ